MKFVLHIILLSIVSSMNLLCNNLVVSDLQLVEADLLSCTISWENSWNLTEIKPNNHDAVWLFAKIKIGNTWQHLLLDQDIEKSNCDSEDVILNLEPNGRGLLVKSNLAGEGSIENIKIEIRLNSAVSNTENVEIQVFGIEMVYINAGPFFIGDGGAQESFINIESNGPYLLVDESSFFLKEILPFSSFDDALKIPQKFPKGTDGFYCMKYEISQIQFTDFLNTLDYNQQNERVNISLDEDIGKRVMSQFNRNGIVLAQSTSYSGVPAVFACDMNGNLIFNEFDDGQGTACNFLSGSDVRAYLDWACLRPMTELEFEKIGRGPVFPIPKEYVWGDTLFYAPNLLQNEFEPSETYLSEFTYNKGVANYNYSVINGPVRCGFAANSQTTRISSGAGYFGVMEFTGNVWEYCIALDTVGIDFEGNLGDGLLDEFGNANEHSWPADDFAGSILRGGGWNSGDFENFSDGAISDRYYFLQSVDKKRNTTGGRGVLRF